MFFHALDALHYTPPGALASTVQPVTVMHLLVAVNGDSHQPVVVAQKAAPRIVQKNRIGLERIAHGLAVPSKLLLVGNQFLEELQPGKGRLPALEGKRGLRVRVEEIRFHHAPQCVVGHPFLRDLLVRVKLPVKVEAVFTIEITQGGCRFDQEGGDAA
jgi:hypothetical protein